MLSRIWNSITLVVCALILLLFLSSLREKRMRDLSESYTDLKARYERLQKMCSAGSTPGSQP